VTVQNTVEVPGLSSDEIERLIEEKLSRFERELLRDMDRI